MKLECHTCEFLVSDEEAYFKCTFFKKHGLFHANLIRNNDGDHPIKYRDKPLIKVHSLGYSFVFYMWPFRFSPLWVEECQVPYFRNL